MARQQMVLGVTRRQIQVGFVVAVLVGLFLLGRFARTAIPVGVGYAAKFVCSQHFISGQAPEETLDLEIRKMMFPIGPLLHAVVDDDEKTVDVDVLGRVTAHAEFRPGLGCGVHVDESSPTSTTHIGTSSGGFELGDANPRCFDAAKLERALDEAFREPDDELRRTKAIVVVHDGAIAAERYAAGWTEETPLLGWSMSKSVTSTMLGVLVRQGKLSLDDRPFRRASDPRNSITLEHLIRMTSGLAVEETHTGADPVSQMLYLEPDMAAYVMRSTMKEKPGKRFEYTSGNTVVVSRAIRDAVGGSLQDQLDFFQREIAVPLGLRNLVFEADASGTLVGCSYVLASPRDWARLGLLYLNDGVVNGRRVLDSDWIASATRPTENLDVPAPYGAGFWLNSVVGEDGQRLWPSLPEEVYSFRGFQGQYVLIIPSKKLVIVRLGTSQGHELTGVEAFAKHVLEAQKSQCTKS